jgi:transposase
MFELFHHGSQECPQCESTLSNVQGIETCPDCGWLPAAPAP